MRIGVGAIFHDDGGGTAKHLNSLLDEWTKQPSEDKYYLFVNENGYRNLHVDKTSIKVIKANRMANYRLGAVIWHQFVLPILVKRLSIDVLFLSCNPFVVWKMCPVVAMIRDLRERRVAGIYSPLHTFYRNKISNPCTTRFSTHLITISQSSKDDILEFYPVAVDKVSVVHHGIKPDRYKKSDFQSVLDKFSLNGSYILNVGRIDPLGNKNQIRLLKAFELFSRQVETSYHIVLAGPIIRTGFMRRSALELLEFLLNYTLKERVIITGYVSETELMNLYAHASFLVFPSLYEGFGHPLLEAMVNGCPICCSNVSSLPEIAGNAALYFNPYDVESMASAMLKMASDEPLRARLVASGLKRVRNLSWEVTAKRTMNILKSVVQRRGN